MNIKKITKIICLLIIFFACFCLFNTNVNAATKDNMYKYLKDTYGGLGEKCLLHDIVIVYQNENGKGAKEEYQNLKSQINKQSNITVDDLKNLSDQNKKKFACYNVIEDMCGGLSKWYQMSLEEHLKEYQNALLKDGCSIWHREMSDSSIILKINNDTLNNNIEDKNNIIKYECKGNITLYATSIDDLKKQYSSQCGTGGIGGNTLKCLCYPEAIQKFTDNENYLNALNNQQCDNYQTKDAIILKIKEIAPKFKDEDLNMQIRGFINKHQIKDEADKLLLECLFTKAKNACYSMSLEECENKVNKDIASSIINIDFDDVEGNCETILWYQKLKDFILMIFNYIRIIAVLLLIIFGAIDFIKVMISGEVDQMKKTINKFIKRVIFTVLIFLLPVILNLIFNLFPSVFFGTEDPLCDIFKER